MGKEFVCVCVCKERDGQSGRARDRERHTLTKKGKKSKWEHVKKCCQKRSQRLYLTTEGWVLPPQREWLSIPGFQKEFWFNEISLFSVKVMHSTDNEMPIFFSSSVRIFIWIWWTRWGLKESHVRLSVVIFGSECVAAAGTSSTDWRYHWVLGWPNPDAWTSRMFPSEWGKCSKQNKQTKKPLWTEICLHGHDHDYVMSEKADAFAPFNFPPSPNSPSLPA